MWEEIVTKLDLQSRHFPGLSEEKHGVRLSRIAAPWAEI